MRAPATEEDLYARLDALGLAHRTYRHPPVFTVAESADLKRALPGAHTKNLFLKDKKGALALVCAHADARIDLNQTAALIGMGRPSFAAADLLMTDLGVTPGSVTVFALINDQARRVRLVLDAALLDADLVNFHPLRNDATTALTPADLLKFIASTGREAVIVRFDVDGRPTRVELARPPNHLARQESETPA